ncbi:hypothetical protein CDAR_43191 [Caerostris darwini]|uniref:Uncharacterized protein n=1 Tax=Caerostris darwini TaxID=1538125 RepID=A0AAV4WHW8_9ARAC|nr:hypothetical protein CDAR_43191 [Caerostris darwini]
MQIAMAARDLIGKALVHQSYQSETRALVEPVPLVGPSSPTLSDRTEAFLRVRGEASQHKKTTRVSQRRGQKVPDPKKIQNTLLKEPEEKEEKKRTKNSNGRTSNPRKVGKTKVIKCLEIPVGVERLNEGAFGDLL